MGPRIFIIARRDNICRVCAQQDVSGVIDIFSEEGVLNEIAGNIFALSGVDIKATDALPKTVCECCRQKLFAAVRFKDMCRKSDSDMKEARFVYLKVHTDGNGTSPSSQSNIGAGRAKRTGVKRTSNAGKLRRQQENITNDRVPEPVDPLAEEIPVKTDRRASLSDAEENDPIRPHVPKKIIPGRRFGKEQKQTPSSLCHICSKEFTYPMQLKRHIALHARKKINLTSTKGSFACSHCNKKYVSDWGLRIHLQTHSKRHKCDKCRKVYNREHDLREHVLRVHEKSAQFACQHCGDVKYTRRQLRLHFRMHFTAKKIPDK